MRLFQQWLLDIVFVGIAGIAAVELRFGYGFDFASYLPLSLYFVATLVAWAFASFIVGTNRLIWRFSSIDDFVQIFWAGLISVSIATGVVFGFNRLEGVARSFPLVHLLTIIVVLVGARLALRLRAVRRTVRNARAHPIAAAPDKTVLLIGTGTLANLYLQWNAEVGHGLTYVAGIVSQRADKIGRKTFNVPILGSIEDLGQVIDQLAVKGVVPDELVVTLPVGSNDILRQDLDSIGRERGIPITYVSERLGFSAAPISAPLVREALRSDPPAQPTLRLQPKSGLYWSTKRLIDIMVAGTILIVLSPIFVFVCAAIAVDLGLPVFFHQRRPGLGGRPFWCLKLRTMRDAFDAKGQRIPDVKRTTWLGNLVRKMRIDEVPQLINVLRGDMSLIGPRPLLPVDQPTDADWRLSVRPGLTGWAQVCGGRTVSSMDKAALDFWYLEQASVRSDIKIAYRTLLVVLWGERVDPSALLKARRLMSDAVEDMQRQHKAAIGAPLTRRSAAALIGHQPQVTI